MSSVDPVMSIDSRRHFMLAVRRVLRPIIRLMIRHGVSYAEFADVARGAYVESAIRDAANEDMKPTREEVARITGIPRQRVDRYIDDEDALPTAPATLTNVLVEVLHKWHTDPTYQGADGSPVDLDVNAASRPNFRGLVAEVDAKVNSDVVLEALLEAQSVTHSGDDRIHAVTRCFIWPDKSLASIELLGTALTQLIETYEYNFNSAHAENKRLERSVFPDQGLSRKLLPKFHAHVRERTDQFLLDIDNWIAQCADVTTDHSTASVAAGVNVFLYVDPPPDRRALSTLVQSRRDMASDSDQSTA